MINIIIVAVVAFFIGCVVTASVLKKRCKHEWEYVEDTRSWNDTRWRVNECKICKEIWKQEIN